MAFRLIPILEVQLLHVAPLARTAASLAVDAEYICGMDDAGI